MKKEISEANGSILIVASPSKGWLRPRVRGVSDVANPWLWIDAHDAYFG
ncbi:hypothetical protein [Parapedobacter pyrenivorans]|nr:hypothetical protein [Parapedobacter pyrenivorans]